MHLTDLEQEIQREINFATDLLLSPNNYIKKIKTASTYAFAQTARG